MKTIRNGMLFAAIASATAGASAAILTPGSSSGLTGWTPADGGSIIYSQSYSFASIGVPLGGVTSTGTLEQTITQQLSGELLFSLRISQLTTGADTHLSSVLVGKWAGFSVDTDFLLDSGLSNPAMASRSGGAGDKVSWSDFDGPMSDGKNTGWMQVLTNAVGYDVDTAHIVLNFSDGSRAQFGVAAPSTIPAPGAVALLIGAACFGTRRRR